MGEFKQMFIIMLCINILLVVGGVTSFQDGKDNGNMLGGLVNFTYKNDSSIEASNLNSDLTKATSEVGSRGTITTGTFAGFTDTPSAIYLFFKFMLEILTSPFNLLLNPNLFLPWQFRIMIGVPLSLLWVISIIGFWRNGV